MLAEREGERLHVRVQEFDREGMVDHRAALAYQLIKPLIGDRTAAVGRYVRAMADSLDRARRHGGDVLFRIAGSVLLVSSASFGFSLYFSRYVRK